MGIDKLRSARGAPARTIHRPPAATKRTPQNFLFSGVWRAKIACTGRTPIKRTPLHWIAPSLIRTIPSASDSHRTPALRLTGFPVGLDYRRSGIGIAPSPCPEGSSIRLWVHYGKCGARGQIKGLGSGERGLGNGERGLGSGDWGAGTGDWGTGNGERGTGTGNYPIPSPYSPASSSFTERRWGKRITSRMVSLSVRSITSRSMPIPKPPVGGIP